MKLVYVKRIKMAEGKKTVEELIMFSQKESV